MNVIDSLRGHLLIASPQIVDPSFHRTVVVMAEHGDEGALGLVLNRPAATRVGDALTELTWLAGDGDEPIWIGGPVASEAVIVVAEFDDPAQAAMVIEGDVGLVPAHIEDQAAFANGLRRTRVFAGHAGWSPGQLEEELEQESWIVEPVRAEDLFAADAERLWSTVLRRKGREYALLATMPADPSLN